MSELSWAVRVKVEIEKRTHLLYVGEGLKIVKSESPHFEVGSQIEKAFSKCLKNKWRAWVSN